MIMLYLGGGIGHMHQNRTVTYKNAMDTVNSAVTVEDFTTMPMYIDEEDEAEVGLYQSDEDKESGDEDDDTEALGPADEEVVDATDCD